MYQSERLTLIQYEPVNPNERFHSSLFDEVDNEKLARSLVHCASVCQQVGAEKCIIDIPKFMDRTISALGTSDSFLRSAAFSLFSDLIEASCVIPLYPRMWNRLHAAFRDGRLEEQDALIWISTVWILGHVGSDSLPAFPCNKFDWDGLFSADLNEKTTFLFSILFILILRHSSIEEQIGRINTANIILSFEQHQHVVSRIVSIFDDTSQLENLRNPRHHISYCVLIALLSNCDFHPILTTFITQTPDIDVHALLPHENNLFLLCHSSLNPHKPHQLPLDLLFERTLRTRPLDFFISSKKSHFDLPPSLLNTSLHFSSLSLFPTAARLKSTPSDLADHLKLMMTTLLLTTAPFGDLQSVRELYRSVCQRADESKSSSTEWFVTSHCEALEWLHIPTGFGSALAHSETPVTSEDWEALIGLRISIDVPHNPTHVGTAALDILLDQTGCVRDGITHVGSHIDHFDI
ncbi:hypothetical protein BLNAU_9546 [Blattamonas nauphoetae]|uniref:Uncharacterized protein n=1 Tax=Blattamonas nauphoetae TaxID=2049346 RepID=A0ABQ9XVJ2_9EUKA|nr:hypothetical protein BLNAU_9546 [Blattamonas nauphoetae]